MIFAVHKRNSTKSVNIILADDIQDALLKMAGSEGELDGQAYTPQDFEAYPVLPFNAGDDVRRLTGLALEATISQAGRAQTEIEAQKALAFRCQRDAAQDRADLLNEKDRHGDTQNEYSAVLRRQGWLVAAIWILIVLVMSLGFSLAEMAKKLAEPVEIQLDFKTQGNEQWQTLNLEN